MDRNDLCRLGTRMIAVLGLALLAIGEARGQGLTQRGNFNTVTAEVGSGASLEQIQIGHRNGASIGGDNVLSPNAGSFYRQVQRGNRNTAMIGETNVLTEVRQLQVGDRNHAAFETTDGTDSWFNAGVFEQTQRGNENVMRTHVGFKQWKRSNIRQVQHGDRNRARVKNAASGGRGVLDTRQSGDRNVLRFDWNHRQASTLELRQEGRRNVLEGGFNHVGQSLRVDQVGRRNEADVRFGSTPSPSTVMQFGNDNYVEINR